MLGITAVPSIGDLIGFGVFALSVAAFIYGRKAGDNAKTSRPPEPSTSGIAAGFVDKDLMMRLTMATESIAGTLKSYLEIQTDKHEQEVQSLLRKIAEKLPGG